MNSDPQRILFVIEALETVLRDWTTSFSLSEEQVHSAIMGASRSVAAFAAQSQIVLTSAERELEASLKVEEAAKAVREEAAQCVGAADTTIREARKAVSAAEAAVAAWQSALERARSYLQSVRHELAAARRKLQSAETVQAQANYELDAARSALHSCQSSYTTDSKGRRVYRDCSAESARVDLAHARLHTAIATVNQWRAKVADWIQAEREAIDTVTRYAHGVEIAANARSTASQAMEIALSAERHANEATRWANSAETGAVAMAGVVRDGHGLAEGARAISAVADDQAASMQNQGRRLRGIASDHLTHSARAGNTLADAFDALRQFNRPTGP